MTTGPIETSLPAVEPIEDVEKSESDEDTGEIPLASMERILNS